MDARDNTGAGTEAKWMSVKIKVEEEMKVER